MIKRRPQRLDLIYSGEPVYFVTFCTRARQRIPDLGKAQTALEAYAQRGTEEFGAALGRYVIIRITFTCSCLVMLILCFRNGWQD